MKKDVWHTELFRKCTMCARISTVNFDLSSLVRQVFCSSSSSSSYISFEYRRFCCIENVDHLEGIVISASIKSSAVARSRCPDRPGPRVVHTKSENEKTTDYHLMSIRTRRDATKMDRT
ncbi:unnamed protein product [Trichogramma brassicae]|uniref:Uncharacterized protein n=1 Tax=Trichogramma brassicae TaxID=86971 RepID=A0A6H5IF74_9HYME|nr:unnamed protein product [Trichogramma brassicae]